MFDKRKREKTNAVIACDSIQQNVQIVAEKTTLNECVAII